MGLIVGTGAKAERLQRVADWKKFEVLEGAGELRTRNRGSVCGGPTREGTGVVGPSVGGIPYVGNPFFIINLYCLKTTGDLATSCC